MSESRETVKESASIIQEIETQLERILSKRKDDIERSLAGTIQKEKEVARKKIDDAEKEFDGERDVLHEFKVMIVENEAERAAVLDEIRERHKRVLLCQEEIGSLAKRTIDEMRKIGELNQKLEKMREKTEERSGFLKKDLRERFGIISDIPDKEESADMRVSLDEELEKLRKIKELLAGESRAVSGNGEPEEGDIPEDPSVEAQKGSMDMRIPEIHDLVQAASFSPDAPPLQEARGNKAASHPLMDILDGLRKTEPVGNGDEIGYFQKGGKLILDAERFISLLEESVEDAKRLSLRLGETETPKDRFLIKHDLINGQERLRKLVIRAVRLCENSSPGFPGKTRDALNADEIKEILNQLSAENWANPEDLASFEKSLNFLRSGFQNGSIPRDEYLKSILEDLGAL